MERIGTGFLHADKRTVLTTRSVKNYEIKMNLDSTGFDAETVRSIVNHMNEDHADALRLYIKAFTSIDPALITDLRMTDIDTDGISLTYKIDNEALHARITFEQTIGKNLKHATGARGALVAMVKRARQ